IRGVKRSPMYTPATRAAQHDGYRRAPAVVRLGDEIRNLVEAAGNEVNELHLGHRAQAQVAHAYGRAHNSRLADGRIDYALPAKTLEQAGRHLECATIDADVFAQQYHRGVALHLFKERLPDRFEVGHRGHGYLFTLRVGFAIFALRFPFSGS